MFTEGIDAFKAMGSEPRQLILGAIERGVKNPSAIGRLLHMPRSTVEKHIRILLAARIVRKVPVLKERDRLGVNYELNPLALRLRDALVQP